ncbi:MAG: hypothetical protein LBJ24_06505 [Treponema sp.]|jgi:hypothetical protein|nr:hypothetical protein [Treponema sp.]
MRGPFLLFCLGCFLAVAAAQEIPEPQVPAEPGAPAEGRSSMESYLIPQTVFVGDPGRLVCLLKDPVPPGENLVLDMPGDLSGTKDLIITRIELDRRGEKARLLVDFHAFSPGLISLPPVEIASRSFTGLEVRVSSILESDEDLVLSSPAPPLAVPGTVLVIYGAVFAGIVVILGLVFGGIWYGKRLDYLRTRGLRRQALRSMWKMLRQLRSALGRNRTGEGEALTLAASEFRNFLSCFSGMNCRAMIPGEFLGLPSLFPPEERKASFDINGFLRDLFRRCDTLRFSGAVIDRKITFDVMKDIRTFVSALEKAEKQNAVPVLSGSAGKVPAGGGPSAGGLR